jgi:hypothetical protein
MISIVVPLIYIPTNSVSGFIFHASSLAFDFFLDDCHSDWSEMHLSETDDIF